MSPRADAIAWVDDVLDRLRREPGMTVQRSIDWTQSLRPRLAAVAPEVARLLAGLDLGASGPAAVEALAERIDRARRPRSLLLLSASKGLVTGRDNLDWALDTVETTLARLRPGDVLLTGDTPIELMARRMADRAGLAWVVFHADGSRAQRDGQGPASWGAPTGKSLAEDRSKALAVAALAAQARDVTVDCLTLLDAGWTPWSESARRWRACEGAGLVSNRLVAGSLDLEAAA